MKQNSLLFLLLVITSCSLKPETQLEEIYAMMEGSFNSQEQSIENPKYHNVTLQLAHIWEEREGKWVYAEYGLTKNPKAIYSHRVFKLTETSGKEVEMQSFELKNWENFIGKWKEPKAFDSITENDIVPRDGCDISFVKEGETYIGKTKGKCSRAVGKADYSIHEFIVSPDRIANWSRGFNTSDSLVWGHSDGGYIFKRIEELP